MMELEDRELGILVLKMKPPRFRRRPSFIDSDTASDWLLDTRSFPDTTNKSEWVFLGVKE